MINKNIIPQHWEIKLLGDVCEIFQGYGFPLSLQGKKEGSIKVFKVGDISQNVQSGNKYLEFTRNYIDETDLIKLKAKVLPKNTIVFAKIGEALKLNRRALTNGPCIVDNNAIGLKANLNFCLDLFLYYYLSLVSKRYFLKAL